MQDFEFKIRYDVLPSNIIYNQCGPSIQKHGSAEQMQHTIDARNKKDEFYNLLEKSILEHGIRNPIVVNAGWIAESKLYSLPLEMQQNKHKILACDRHGGSRLWIAQKYNLPIPCIINDFCERFSEAEELFTEKEILNKFLDSIERITINAHGVHTYKLEHIHLKK